MIPTARYYGPTDGPPKQGDILFAGVTRFVAEDRFTPTPWQRLDAYDVTVESPAGGQEFRLAAGPALVMVTSHDCHFDKDWNWRRSALLAEGVDEREADRLAEEDHTLDRTFTASPLVFPSEVDRDQGNLLAGRILGYFPVPASQDGLVPEAVVDLTYRVTLDRLDIVRVACLSTEARAQLRYGLVQLDSLRATKLGFEVEAVIGRSIENVTLPKGQPLSVRLHLDNGTTIDLIKQPDEPGDGPARPTPPGPRVAG